MTPALACSQPQPLWFFNLSICTELHSWGLCPTAEVQAQTEVRERTGDRARVGQAACCLHLAKLVLQCI